MKDSTILIAMSQDASLTDLAKRLEAIRAIPARAAILIIGEVPDFPYYGIGIPPYGGTEIPPAWQEAISSVHADLKTKSDDVEFLLQQHGVSGAVHTIGCAPSQVADAIARRASLCDIAIVSEDLRTPDTLFRQTVFGILFQSPIGVLLNDVDGQALTRAGKIFVAWNTHLHTARAVHQALPLLRKAEDVIIASVDPVMTEYREGEDPGVDVAKWLTHHGCNITVEQYPSGGKDIAECILDQSKECGADLIVMGAYGHSRAWEALFGGTTRHLIEQEEQAVFLAH